MNNDKYIEKLMAKPALTGKEVGRAVLMDHIEAFSVSVRDEKEGTKRMSKEQLEVLISKIVDENEFRIYKNFLQAEMYLQTERGYAASFYQYARLGLLEITDAVESVIQYEDCLHTSFSAPRIVTKKQYLRLLKDSEQKAKDEYITVHMLFLLMIHYYSGQGNMDPKKKRFDSIVERLNTKDTSCSRILDLYNKKYNGYYVTEDGVRSDQCDYKTWKKKISELYIGEHIMGIESSHFRFLDELDLYSDELLLLDGIKDKVKWMPYVIYKTVSCLDIFKELRYFFPALFDEYKYYDFSEEDALEQHEEFVEIFRELFDFLVEDAREKIDGFYKFGGDGYISSSIKIETLLKNGLYGIDQWFHKMVNTLMFSNEKNEKKWNGISIIRDEDLKITQLDENGDYVQQDYCTGNNIITLASQAEKRQSIRYALHEKMLNGSKHVYAYNEVVRIISELTGVDFSSYSFTAPMLALANSIRLLNEDIAELYHIIVKNNDMMPKTEQYFRNKFAKEYFPFVNIWACKPSKKAIMETKEYLKDFSAFYKDTTVIIENLVK